MSDDPNPWADATWNLTQQAKYIHDHGFVMARARAHDAGTEIGAPRQRPKPPEGKAPVYVFNKRIAQTTKTNGSAFLTGHGAPSDALGVDNDVYLDLDTQTLYEKVGGTWA